MKIIGWGYVENYHKRLWALRVEELGDLHCVDVPPNPQLDDEGRWVDIVEWMNETVEHPWTIATDDYYNGTSYLCFSDLNTAALFKLTFG